MIDRYTKFVLTVIAVALSVIAGQNLAPNAAAQFVACGSEQRPCFVRIVDAGRYRPVGE
jgi:hypothetical protein